MKNIVLGFNLYFVFTFSAHPWVKEGGDALEIPIDISVLNNMRQFVKYSRLKQFALRVTWFSLIGVLQFRRQNVLFIICFGLNI